MAGISFTPGPYSGDTARACAELSNLVYGYPALIRRRATTEFEFADVHIATTWLANSRVVIFSRAGEIVVTFRGTVRGARSWIVNFKAMRKRWGTGRVHRGFLRAFLRAWPFISARINDYQDGTKALYFTGHSQGGAVGLLAAFTFEISTGTQSPDAVYTFGQPRAGNKAFCREIEQRMARRISRVVNNRDVVVGVPFVRQGYDHFREYLHYGKRWKVTRRKLGIGETWKLSRGGVADHEMIQYLRRAHVNEPEPPV